MEAQANSTKVIASLLSQSHWSSVHSISSPIYLIVNTMRYIGFQPIRHNVNKSGGGECFQSRRTWCAGIASVHAFVAPKQNATSLV